jgi:2-polyprenyl-6-methoxyphenol hydroxylase-like FAD-dependent oxidoreductase
MSRMRLLIAGGGPVGLALAAACENADVEVVEASVPRDAPLPSELDLRVYALSPGSRAMLRDIGAWDALDAARIAPVRRMAVFGDGSSSLSFAPPAGETLAWIVEGNRLAAALDEALAARGEIRVRRGETARDFEASAERAAIALESGERIEGDLLVGADGPDSRVRAHFGIEAEEHRYDESAVVAHFDCEKPHEGIARQWFRPDGVLAWLPPSGPRRLDRLVGAAAGGRRAGGPAGRGARGARGGGGRQDARRHAAHFPGGSFPAAAGSRGRSGSPGCGARGRCRASPCIRSPGKASTWDSRTRRRSPESSRNAPRSSARETCGSCGATPAPGAKT